MLIRIVFRNIFRNGRRTLITVMTIASGTIAVFLAGGFINNMYEGLREFSVHSNTGHLQVFQVGYLEKNAIAPFDYLIHNDNGIIQKIRAVEHVRTEPLPRLFFQGLLSTGAPTRPFLGIGVDPPGERELAQVPPEATKYRYVGTSVFSLEGEDVTEDEPFGAVLGKGLAASMGLKIGDEVTLLTTTRQGSINGMNVKVRGIAMGGLKEYDDFVLKLPIKTVERTLNLENSYSLLVVFLDDPARTEEVRGYLSNLFKSEGLPYEIKSWQELSHLYQSFVVMFDSIFSILTFVIYGIVVIGISNNMMMAVFERTKEIGIMMAIGRKETDIILLFLMEALVLGLIGGIIGVILGTVIAEIISAIGIPMAPPPGFTRIFIHRVNLVPAVIFTSLVLSILSTLLAGLYPAIRAVRLNVVEALKHV